MLSECQQNGDYAKAAMVRGEHYSAEPLFTALIFEQQKMISKLIDKLAKSKL
jgi:hypothetical protein